MNEITGDLWTLPADWRCITTNGTVRKDGKLVMGRGCAAQARDRYPGLAEELGRYVDLLGNHVGIFAAYRLVTFPVKNHWSDQACMDLIVRSASELAVVARERSGEVFLLPRPGCGNGRLRWDDVGPEISGILPDNVHVVTFAQDDQL